MVHCIHSVALYGMDGIPISVEADVRNGFPAFEMFGDLSAQVKEAGGRVRSALYNSGYSMKPQRISINLSPANVRKEGNAFDLPIAVAILASFLPLSAEKLAQTMFAGELGLDGSIRRIPGILPMVFAAREAGWRCCVIPEENRKEASVLPEMELLGVGSLQEVVAFLTERGGCACPAVRYTGKEGKTADIEESEAAKEREAAEESEGDRRKREDRPDFAEVAGQQGIKRAIEVAVSGRHNLLLIGSAGSGKTMLARRVPGILPLMNKKEQLELSRLYSAAGLLKEEPYLIKERPFRSPHHSITKAAMAGGGRIPRAGEISLAHQGVLFLDELAEFSSETLETLRQPLEEQQITLSRTYGTVTYPADFFLIAAMNPCRCGYYPDRSRCRCDEAQVKRYLNRISGPLLERLDLVASVEPVSWREMTCPADGMEPMSGIETSAMIRERVAHVWQIQRERFAGEGILYNSRMNQRQVERYCPLGKAERELLEEAFLRFGISARVYHKILKIARTIADMEESERITEGHLSEAIHYRGAVIQFWG